MTDISQIREHMEVVGSDGQHVGTVDSVENGNIKLTKGDSEENLHHLIPIDWVDSVEQDEIRLDRISGDVEAEWSETGEGETGGNGT